MRGQTVCPSLCPLSQFRYPEHPAVPRVAPTQVPYGHSGICSSVLTRCHGSTIVTSPMSGLSQGRCSVCLLTVLSVFLPLPSSGGCPMVSHSLEGGSVSLFRSVPLAPVLGQGKARLCF